jgi:hypothetical protein
LRARPNRPRLAWSEYLPSHELRMQGRTAIVVANIALALRANRILTLVTGFGLRKVFT